MFKLKGITVTLLSKTQTGTDDFNRPIYTETPVFVDNVLVAPSGYTEEVTDSLYLSADSTKYNLAIPKGDNNTWQDCKVQFFGSTWQVVGEPVMGIEDMIPLEWNKKVQVEKIE